MIDVPRLLLIVHVLFFSHIFIAYTWINPLHWKWGKRKVDDYLNIFINFFPKDNALQDVPEDIVSWQSLKSLHLEGNPFLCVCELFWLRDLLSDEKFKNSSSFVLCAEPGNLRDKKLTSLSSQDLNCYLQVSCQYWLELAYTLRCIHMCLYPFIIRRVLFKRRYWGLPLLWRSSSWWSYFSCCTATTRTSREPANVASVDPLEESGAPSFLPVEKNWILLQKRPFSAIKAHTLSRTTTSQVSN